MSFGQRAELGLGQRGVEAGEVLILGELLAHRVGAADDDDADLTSSSIVCGLAGDLGGAHALHRVDVGVAGRQQHLGRHLQQAVHQRFEMRLAPRASPSRRCRRHRWCSTTRAGRARPGSPPSRPRRDRAGRSVATAAIGAQRLAIGVAHLRRPADGRAGALRRNPDRRMRRLLRPRPRIDVVELIVLARHRRTGRARSRRARSGRAPRRSAPATSAGLMPME